MNAKFPVLKRYDKNWATIRMLQAHLKAKNAAYRQTKVQETIDTVTSAFSPRRRQVRLLSLYWQTSDDFLANGLIIYVHCEIYTYCTCTLRNVYSLPVSTRFGL